MHLLLVGISHRTAPVEVRERLDFVSRGLEQALRSLAERGTSREAVVVSTCNRAELYAACDEVSDTAKDLVQFIAEFHGADRAVLASHTY